MSEGGERSGGEQRGFWSERPRRGQDDARLLAVDELHALRQLGYDELRARAGAGPVVEDVRGLSGRLYKRRTSIARQGRGGREELRIVVQVDDGTPPGRLSPLAEELALAGPDGEMTGAWTLAAEGNDPRRYVWPSPWVPVGMLLLAIALIVLAIILL